MNVAVRLAVSVALAAGVVGCGGGGKKNSAPDPVIVDPHESSSHLPTSTIDFRGRATDPEDGVLASSALRWEVRNSANAVVFASPGADVSANLPNPGEYEVTLFAADSKGKEGRSTTTIRVGNTTAELTDPDNYGFIGISTPFDLTGRALTIAPATTISTMTFVGVDLATNAEVFRLPVAATTTVCNGALTVCDATVTPSVPAGRYKMTLEVTTSSTTESAIDTLYVIADSPPVVSITSPVSGSRIAPGTAVSFAGTATDPGGDELTISWTSSIDGEIGSSLSFTRTDLTVAKHRIRLTATDVNGQSSSAAVDLYIEDPGNPLFVTSGSASVTDVVALAADGDRVWFGRTGPNAYASVSTGSLAVIDANVAIGSIPTAAFRARNGSRVFATDGSGIYVVPAAGGAATIYNNGNTGGELADAVFDVAQNATTGEYVFATDAGLTTASEAFGSFTQHASGLLGNNAAFSVAVAADGTVWVGTDGDGLLKVTGLGGALAVTPITPAQGLAGDVVHDVDVAADGTIWAACDGGLSVIDPVANTVMTYDEDLPDDKVHAVELDADGIVWLGTEDGAVRLDTATDRITHFTGADLASTFVTDIALDGSGDKYFACRNAGGQAGGITRYVGE